MSSLPVPLSPVISTELSPPAITFTKSNTSRMRALVRDDRVAEARALQHWIMPLARSVGGTYGVAGFKAALDLSGYKGGMPRPPLRPASAQVVETIRGQLAALGAFKDLFVEIS